ncbi:hypothetical protein DCC39_16085 [Pueribacillus theae]|uniref:Uncharacterized protein n=1 Tax=Pueribacillus theae TaxID=2171751 RepID=A0A2U1JS32_9BACI|nr:hypothetical protein [Pueribacillus theae]PWA07815.1 hypothetical protein DCC39_16085 [Pueribacillus theae]
MYKYSVFSLILLISFVLLYSWGPGLLFYGFFGKLEVAFLVLLPLAGAIFAFKGNGWTKGVLLILNLIAFIFIAYVLIIVIGYKYGN